MYKNNIINGEIQKKSSEMSMPIDEQISNDILQIDDEDIRDTERNLRFWYLNKDGELRIDYSNSLIDFLAEEGYMNYKDADDVFFVQLKENILSRVSQFDIKQFIKEYIKKLPAKITIQQAEETKKISNKELLSTFIKGSNIYLSRNVLEYLPIFDRNMLKDTETKSYFSYRNGFIECTKEDYVLKPYKDLPAVIWKDEIINRDFTEKVDTTEMPFNEGKPSSPEFNYLDFIHKVSNQDKERVISLMTLLGYLLHDYHNYTKFAVNLTDMRISEGTEANGRSGKTIIGKSLDKVRRQVEINGKNFNLQDKHRFEHCSINTQMVHINDLDQEFRHFDFKGLYNDITESIEVNPKRLKPYYINAKMLITSNKVIRGEGDSHKARLCEYEVSDFFNIDNQINDFYNDWFFSANWKKDSWTVFDNFMMQCVQYFLKFGVVRPKSVNLERRKFEEATSPEFVSFVNNDLIIGKEYTREELKAEFTKIYPEYLNKAFMNSGKMFDWLKIFAKYKNYRFENRESHGQRFIAIYEKGI